MPLTARGIPKRLSEFESLATAQCVARKAAGRLHLTLLVAHPILAKKR
jgi:hypothetical protein